MLERLYGLPAGSITESNCRTDVLIVTTDGRPHFLSIKDPHTQAKLGQVSTTTKYGRGSLTGGLNGFVLPSLQLPKKVDVGDTYLTPSQFDKLSNKDRSYAFIKAQYPDIWKEAVNSRIAKAVHASKRLGDVMATDRDSFLAFLGEVLAGNLVDSRDFYILLGDKPVRFQHVMNKLKKSRFQVSWQEYKTRAKTSIVIWLEINSEKYCITKIEPAFDGGSAKTLQTKGVIFYFQQHLSSANSYKNLLLDLS